ncbi:bifunctional diaminohydroxyphosphoribosylaminopyrimidine deaminase/5-amino-6-(5-phosphoribosylamino)uracil reductase RibD [Neorhodopirellula lusitana]|uniref:bifunctional diaminohydroxyphosphoribosylaminopyrimidine deaminase/5-amino-6-(5-phosphoribosylamino)uracil reductase RibD n=1 Tax=Neorhodopirellula lusitana TaxID=445327 RepID=UPI003850CB23
MPEAPQESELVTDEHWMDQAIELAWRGQGYVEPNPMVGCVIVRDGRLIGQGYHQVFGEAHAEVNALADCQRAGEDAAGATAYVTLEPCCHHGKTPPCADALVAAQVKRVVVAVVDPFDAVDGGGVSRLRDAGIDVVTGIATVKATQLLAPYLKRVRTGKPWVIAKWAMSMDGRIATSTGESQWITGPESRKEVHRLRGRVDAIATGMGTVQVDDPSLTAREGGPRQPTRVVFARSRCPGIDSQLVRTASQVPTWLAVGPAISDCDLALLADHDVEFMRCRSAGQTEMVDEVLARLGAGDNPSGQVITNLMLECGGGLLGSFAAAGQIDEAHVYIGSKLIGGLAAPGPIGDPGVALLADALGFEITDVSQFGADVRLIYRRLDS